MKIRNSFVSNSSSTSFLFQFSGETREDLADLLTKDMFTIHGNYIINSIRNGAGELRPIEELLFDKFSRGNTIKKFKEYENCYDKGIAHFLVLDIGDTEGDIMGNQVGEDGRVGKIDFTINETDKLILERWVG